MQNNKFTKKLIIALILFVLSNSFIFFLLDYTKENQIANLYKKGQVENISNINNNKVKASIFNNSLMQIKDNKKVANLEKAYNELLNKRLQEVQANTFLYINKNKEISNSEKFNVIVNNKQKELESHLTKEEMNLVEQDLVSIKNISLNLNEKEKIDKDINNLEEGFINIKIRNDISYIFLFIFIYLINSVLKKENEDINTVLNEIINNSDVKTEEKNKIFKNAYIALVLSLTLTITIGFAYKTKDNIRNYNFNRLSTFYTLDSLNNTDLNLKISNSKNFLELLEVSNNLSDIPGSNEDIYKIENKLKESQDYIDKNRIDIIKENNSIDLYNLEKIEENIELRQNVFREISSNYMNLVSGRRYIKPTSLYISIIRVLSIMHLITIGLLLFSLLLNEEILEYAIKNLNNED